MCISFVSNGPDPLDLSRPCLLIIPSEEGSIEGSKVVSDQNLFLDRSRLSVY